MSTVSLSVAVIGAGFSGLCAAVQLQRQLKKVHLQLFEVSHDAGGTWRDNAYPGRACDIPIHLYWFSFELNPHWSQHFSPQAEIYAYLQGVARKYNLYDRIKLNTLVTCATWDDTRKQWKLEWQEKGAPSVETGYFDVLLAGLGPWRIPNVPDQFKSFKGPTVHTACWDHALDLKDKRVAMVGSGASAVQVIPELAKTVSHLYCYQRTLAWLFPHAQFGYSALIRGIFKIFPILLRLYRFLIYFQHEWMYVNFGFRTALADRVIQLMYRTVVALRLWLAGRPDLIPKLTPKYPAGCKRIAKSEFYLEALSQPNVSVITAGVSEVKGQTIIDKEGNENEIDVLVLATGFDALGFLGQLHIRGRDGQSLNEQWQKDYPKTYKTTTAHGFPNFFMLAGPNSGLRHHSLISVIECQVGMIITCIRHMEDNGIAAMEPTLAAQEAFDASLSQDLQGTVWQRVCNSRYKSAQGKVFAVWPNTVTRFSWTMRNPVFANFHYSLKNAH